MRRIGLSGFFGITVVYGTWGGVCWGVKFCSGKRNPAGCGVAEGTSFVSSVPGYQPPQVDLWESFVDTVNGVECRFCSAIEDTREGSLGYAYLRSECFLRHSHLFHKSNNAILHNFTACMGQSPPVYISKPNAKLRNSVQLSKLLI